MKTNLMDLAEKRSMRSPYYFNLEPITHSEANSAKLSPDCIVENYMFSDVAQLIAAGGVGKTTIALYEMVHIVLGIELWGHKIVKPGVCVLITAEDSREVCIARLKKVCEALALGPDQWAAVMEKVLILDVAGSGWKLLTADGDIKLTELSDEIIDNCKHHDPVLLVIDPAVSFNASESSGNDGAQGLVTAARRIKNGLNCCVRYIHHTGQDAARNKTKDAYAGRGGTALSDGCRMVNVLHPWDKSMGALPLGIDASSEDVLMLMQPKLSYTKPQPDLFIVRDGWSYKSYRRPPPVSTEILLKEQKAQIVRFLESKIKSDVKLTKGAIETGYLDDLNMSRSDFRKGLAQLMTEGTLVERTLPRSEKQGGRTKYLHSTPRGSEVGVARLGHK
ncbi:MAG: RecA-family ATPase [Gammaproteobacteria bacterium]|jgi:RecA-family ATPase